MYGGKFAFQNRLRQLVVGKKFTMSALFYFVFDGRFQVQAPRGAYIRRGDLTEGFLRYDFGGLTFGGAYFRNFTVFCLWSQGIVSVVRQLGRLPWSNLKFNAPSSLAKTLSVTIEITTFQSKITFLVSHAQLAELFCASETFADEAAMARKAFKTYAPHSPKGFTASSKTSPALMIPTTTQTNSRWISTVA